MARLTPQHELRHEHATYALAILERGRAHPVPGNPVADRDGTFPLPLPPQNLAYQRNAYLSVMDARDQRITDQQGAAPPEITLAGQFLLTSRTVNGVALDGHQLQRALEHYLTYYLTENRRRAHAREPLLTLEWSDTYADEYWVVVPRNVPTGQRDNSSPLTERYNLTLAAERPAGAPARRADPLAAILKPDPNALAASACPHPSHGSTT